MYVLQHSYVTDARSETKLIGIYSSMESARGAQERLCAQPGFKDHPDKFAIDAYESDMDHWTEGFTNESR